MKKIFYLLFFYPALLFSEGSSLVLGTIDSDESSHMSVVTMRLNQAPQWKDVSVEEHGDFLQVMLPDTIVSSPGQFVDGSGPYLAKIAPYETDDHKAMVRIFLKNLSAGDILKSTQVEVLDKRIVLTIDHNSLPKPKEPVSVISEKKALIEPSSSWNIPSESFITFFQKRVFPYGAFIGIVISFLFLASLTLRRMLRNRRIYSMSMNNPSFDTQKIKLISQMNVSSKQKLSLIQIGDERFLVAVSSDHMQLLTKLEPEISLAQKIQIDAISTSQTPKKNLPPPPPEKPKTTSLEKPSIPHKVTGGTSRVGYRIDDQGITKTKPTNDEAIKDVTQIIREKLKSLPKI